MQIVGSLDYGLGKVADLVIKHVMVPSIAASSVKHRFEEHHEGSNEHCAAILEIVSSSELQVSYQPSYIKTQSLCLVHHVLMWIMMQIITIA